MSKPSEKILRCREKYRHLVWSNPNNAPDEVFIRAALVHPHVLVLADFTSEYGLPRMRQEWEIIAQTPEGNRCAKTVERMFHNFAYVIEKTYP